MINYYEAQAKNYHYKVGMYGGKFMPYHNGHKFCTEVAASFCDKLYLILFYGGDQEEEIMKDNIILPKQFITLDYRRDIIQQEALHITQKTGCYVIPVIIDVTKCKTKDNKEDWDAETPLVLTCCGNLDVVFSSETSYNNYFKQAYPNATHILIDPPRNTFPISGTACRNMTKQEVKKWINYEI